MGIPMSGSELKVACVGAGYFSQFHYGSWARIPEVRCVGACDTDIDRAHATGLPAFDDLPHMLAETRPDILDIIVPPHAHAVVVRAALSAGITRIICQKPFCTSLDEGRAVSNDARLAGATVVIHENFRFQPWYRRAKELIDTGRIGTPLQATFRLRPGDGQGPKAYLNRQPYFQEMPRFLVHETAVHWVDTFRFLFGDPTAVYADLRRINPVIAGEDAGVIVFDHPNGVRTVFDGNRHLDHASDNTRRTMGEALFEGTEATLTLTGDGALHLRGFGQQVAEVVLEADDCDGFGGDCVHRLQCKTVRDFLQGRQPENSASDYLRVMQVVEAIYRSAEAGQKLTVEYD